MEAWVLTQYSNIPLFSRILGVTTFVNLNAFGWYKSIHTPLLRFM